MTFPLLSARYTCLLSVVAIISCSKEDRGPYLVENFKKEGAIPSDVKVIHAYSTGRITDNEHLFVASNLTDNIWEYLRTNCVEEDELERLMVITNSGVGNVTMMQTLLLKANITNIQPPFKIFYNHVYYEKYGSVVSYIRLTNMTTYILVFDM